MRQAGPSGRVRYNLRQSPGLLSHDLRRGGERSKKRVAARLVGTMKTGRQTVRKAARPGSSAKPTAVMRGSGPRPDLRRSVGPSFSRSPAAMMRRGPPLPRSPAASTRAMLRICRVMSLRIGPTPRPEAWSIILAAD